MGVERQRWAAVEGMRGAGGQPSWVVGEEAYLDPCGVDLESQLGVSLANRCKQPESVIKTSASVVAKAVL